MAIHLSLSSEQAALLMPLLEQISSAAVSNSSTPSRSRQHSILTTSKSPPQLVSPSASGSECQYSTDELLERKRRNSKSSPAQSYLLYTIREAAKAAGLWDKAPYMEEISPQAFRAYFDYVYTACPNLRQSEKELRTRLSDTLMNRRATLRTQQVLSSPKKRGKKARAAVAFLRKDSSSSTSSSVSSSDQPTIGCEVTLTSNKGDDLGSGLYLGEGGDTEAEKRMYARILLLKSVKMKKEIELPSPLETKRFFHQLVEKQDVFLWRHDYIKVKSTPARPKDVKSTPVRPKEVKSTPTRTKKDNSTSARTREVKSSSDSGTSNDSLSGSSDSSDSEESDDERTQGLCPYEIKRLKRIEKNRRAQDKIYGDFLKKYNDNHLTPITTPKGRKSTVGKGRVQQGKKLPAGGKGGRKPITSVTGGKKAIKGGKKKASGKDPAATVGDGDKLDTDGKTHATVESSESGVGANDDKESVVNVITGDEPVASVKAIKDSGSGSLDQLSNEIEPLNKTEKSSGGRKKSKFWEIVSDSEEEKDMFKDIIVEGKRQRKPKIRDY